MECLEYRSAVILQVIGIRLAAGMMLAGRRPGGRRETNERLLPD
jgi:hypothetical protein